MKSIAIAAGLVSLAQADLLGIPTVPFKASSDASFDLRKLQGILVDFNHASDVDPDGLTEVPPTLYSFAQTFQSDLATIGINVQQLPDRTPMPNTIFITIDDDKTKYVDVAGRQTSEGYTINVTDSNIIISGASPLGAWWGTRTVLQQAIINDKKIQLGLGVDSPGWGERGMMLDVARHYYPAEFLIEMCSYLSFFKQNVFHLHLSDSLWDQNRVNSHADASQLYSAFRINPEDPSIAGLPRPMNETYDRLTFNDLQLACANRGVTVIPELESPGHSLATTDWKPELALDDFTMLNLSHPETLPTVKKYWKAVVDNFHSKVVHIGADEYDSNYINDYSTFVNDMNDYIGNISGKSIRIWGTFAPSSDDGAINVSTDVSIQQWQTGQDNGLFDFIDNGYDLLNSDDYFYLDVKYSDGDVYPKQLDVQRVFHGAPDNVGAFSPNVLDHYNASNNPPLDSPSVLGHLAVVWNDWGPNASTYHEAYHMVRDGLPALADKQWGGKLQEEDYAGLFAKLQPAVPGQNLDLNIASKGTTIVSYSFDKPAQGGQTVADQSGNHYDGTLTNGATVKGGALNLNGHGAYLQTALGNKGRNYTLSFSVKPYGPGGNLFSGPYSSLLNGNSTSDKLILLSGDIGYPVDLSLPLDSWSEVSLVGRGPQTFITVNGKREEFTILMGIWGGYMQQAPMAIPAPLNRIGDGFNGQIKDVKLTSEAS